MIRSESSESLSSLPMPSLHIRSATDVDYNAIASIYNEAIAHGGITMDGHTQTVDHVRAMVKKMTNREIILVAVVQDPEQQQEAVVGWGIVKRYSDRLGYQVCCETSIYLSFSAQGKGYGKQLQTAVMEQVRQFGYHHIVAKILATNQGSIRFHQQFGFEVVGVQNEIGFIGGTWHDVVIMQYLFPECPTIPPPPDLQTRKIDNSRLETP